ncbi:MAG: NfeD family protein [Bacteroidia bacterium]|nr:NfeD family protein [Bacteroidia bacterium]
MTLLGIILMILAGLVLFLLELLVIPGISIAGIGALVLMAVSVYLSFSLFGATTGMLVLIGVLISMGLVIALTFRSKTWRRVSLHTQVNSKANDVTGYGIAPGDTGITVTRLGPVGMVEIGEHRVEGHSEGPFIDQQSQIVVTRIEPSFVVVKLKNE